MDNFTVILMCIGATYVSYGMRQNIMNSLERLREERRNRNAREVFNELINNLNRQRENELLRLVQEVVEADLPDETGDAGLASLSEPFQAASFIANRQVKKRIKKIKTLHGAVCKLPKKKFLKAGSEPKNTSSTSRGKNFV